MDHALANLAPPTLGPFEAIGMALEIHHRFHDAFSAVEDKRAILDDVLVEGLPGKENEPSLFRGALLHPSRHRVSFAIVLEDDGVVGGDGGCCIVGAGAVAEGDDAGQGVREGVPALGQFLADLPAGPDGHVEHPDRRVGQISDGIDAMALARDDLDVDPAVVGLHVWDLLGPEISISGFDGLELFGKVHPKLRGNDGSTVPRVSGHLRVHDASSGGHEL